MPVRIDAAIEERVRAAVLAGRSLRAAAADCGVSTNVVQRVTAEVSASQSDDRIRAVVAAMLRQMAAPPEPPKIEVAEGPPTGFPINPRTHVVDLGREYERVAFLSDLHHPFQDDAAIDCTLGVLRDYRPQLLILGGDYFDCYSISDHDKEPGRADCLQDEFDAARETHRKIEDAVSGAPVIWVDGNHEERIRRIQRRTPGLFKLRSMELSVAADLPRRWLYHPNQARFKGGPLTYLHGDTKGRGTNSKHAAAGMLAKLRTSCLFGHLHRFQLFCETADDGSVRYGLANGHLCDVSKAHYITNPDWQQGFTAVEYDWSANLFTPRQHLIWGGRHRCDGKTYGGGTEGRSDIFP